MLAHSGPLPPRLQFHLRSRNIGHLCHGHSRCSIGSKHHDGGTQGLHDKLCRISKNWGATDAQRQRRSLLQRKCWSLTCCSVSRASSTITIRFEFHGFYGRAAYATDVAFLRSSARFRTPFAMCYPDMCEYFIHCWSCWPFFVCPPFFFFSCVYFIGKGDVFILPHPDQTGGKLVLSCFLHVSIS